MIDRMKLFSWNDEIIYCDECRFRGRERLDADGKPYDTCTHPEGMMAAYPGGFCSWGERREHDH